MFHTVSNQHGFIILLVTLIVVSLLLFLSSRTHILYSSGADSLHRALDDLPTEGRVPGRNLTLFWYFQAHHRYYTTVDNQRTCLL